MGSNNPYPVEPTGFLVGSLFACILYGLHLSQIHHYFSTYKRSLLHLLVLWVFSLSTIQIVIILTTAWHYFVFGITNLEGIWGEFWWPLSVQDGLIPLVAFTAQLYFGHRAWILIGRKRWFGIGTVVLPVITLSMGIALAITARQWSDDPFVSLDVFRARKIGTIAEIVAITWMGLTALTDGVLTFTLILTFLRARSAYNSTSIIKRLVSLTLETVLLTHLVGATMCVLFLASPAATRTNQNAFWVLLEVITELYALSILFTINSRSASRDVKRANVAYNENRDQDRRDSDLEGDGFELRQSVLDRRVEGYQGPPLGRLSTMSEYGYEDETDGRRTGIESGGDNRNGANTGTTTDRTGSSRAGGIDSSTPDILTPALEVPNLYFNGWSGIDDHGSKESQKAEGKSS